MTMLSSSSPVAATSRSGGRLIPARSSTKSSVASPRITWCSNSASSLSKRYGLLLDQRHLVAGAEQRPRQVRADLAAACDQDVHQTVRLLGLADGADQRLDRADVGQTIAQAARRVELGARRVEHAHDHRRHLELLLGHLGDHDVRVVAVGRDDDRVGLLDPGLAQELDVHAVTDEEAAGPVSPSRPSASSFSSMTVTSQPDACSCSATAEPTRPQPIDDRLHSGAAYCRSASGRRQLLVHDGLREGDDQHLARRLAEHVVDGRREEARLAPPARRRAEHDQVGARSRARARRSRAPIARARTVVPSTSRRCSAPRSFASASDASAALVLVVERRVERQLERHADHVQRLDLRAVLARRA